MQADQRAWSSAVSTVLVTGALLLLALMLRLDGIQSDVDELREQLRDLRMDLAELDATAADCVPVVLTVPPQPLGGAL